MGYRKVYLTIEEEEDIERIKSVREQEGRPGAAYNAILKEGLAMVMATELARAGKVRTETVSATNVSSANVSSQGRPLRRRRRG